VDITGSNIGITLVTLCHCIKSPMDTHSSHFVPDYAC